MFEAYTLLGALAMRTVSARLLALVSPVTLRNPALLAKCVTTLDVLSRGTGRARRGRRLGRGRARGVRARASPAPASGWTGWMRRSRSAGRCSLTSGPRSAARTTRSRTHPTRRGRWRRSPSWSAGAASAARSTWPRGTPTPATSSGTPRPRGTSSTCSSGTASGPGATRRRSPRPSSRSPPGDLADFARAARAIAAAGADGMIVIGPEDPAQIPAIGQVLAEVFPG